MCLSHRKVRTSKDAAQAVSFEDELAPYQLVGRVMAYQGF